MSKFLIIRFSSIGDIVLTSPVVRNIKKQYPAAEVHFCTKVNFKSVVENNPYIDKLHFYEGDIRKLLTELKKENFDYIIDLHGNFRSFMIKLWLGKKSFSFNKLNFRKWLLVNFKIDKMPDIHIVDRYMETVKKLGINNDGAGLDYFIPEKDKVQLSGIPSLHEKKYIAFVIGAQHATKKLPKERIVELCERINFPIVLLGDKNDKVAGDFIEAQLQKNKVIYNACGMYNLNQSAHLVQQSFKVISHDTGLMHIAAALKKEIYSIWGNTSSRLGMYPYKTKFHISERNNLACRPCSKIGYKKCPKGHFKCMMENPIDTISESLKNQ